jgi:hypothetical protein
MQAGLHKERGARPGMTSLVAICHAVLRRIVLGLVIASAIFKLVNIARVLSQTQLIVILKGLFLTDQFMLLFLLCPLSSPLNLRLVECAASGLESKGEGFCLRSGVMAVAA